MTNEEITKIEALRLSGMGYTRIASELHLSSNSVKSYLIRHPLASAVCKFCGNPIKRTKGKRERMYCSDACRIRWWNKHRYEQHLGNKQQHFCPLCGTKFQGYGKRKYCSVKCAMEARRQQYV